MRTVGLLAFELQGADRIEGDDVIGVEADDLLDILAITACRQWSIRLRTRASLDGLDMAKFLER